MEALVESCNNDIRWVLNTLQMRRKASTKLSYDDVKKQGVSRDVSSLATSRETERPREREKAPSPTRWARLWSRWAGEISELLGWFNRPLYPPHGRQGRGPVSLQRGGHAAGPVLLPKDAQRAHQPHVPGRGPHASLHPGAATAYNLLASPRSLT
eukprot:1182814-Prorocentrum_minimum.AAC.1